MTSREVDSLPRLSGKSPRSSEVWILTLRNHPLAAQRCIRAPVSNLEVIDLRTSGAHRALGGVPPIIYFLLKYQRVRPYNRVIYLSLSCA